jgi:uncharacterized membrane protein
VWVPLARAHVEAGRLVAAEMYLTRIEEQAAAAAEALKAQQRRRLALSAARVVNEKKAQDARDQAREAVELAQDYCTMFDAATPSAAAHYVHRRWVNDATAEERVKSVRTIRLWLAAHWAEVVAAKK